jgi:hypothetical protein
LLGARSIVSLIFRNWVTKPTRSGCPAGTKCVGV